MPDTTPARGPVARIYGNLGRLLGGKIVAALISLAYLVIAARQLGPADYGVLVLVHGFAMAVGGIVAFPCWHAVIRYGAEAVNAGDTPRLVRLLRFTTLIEVAGGIGAVLVAALLGPLLGSRLGWSPVAIAFAVPYSLATLASIRSVPAGYLQLAGRYDLLAAHAVVPALVRLIGAGIAWSADAGLRGFLVAWLVAALAEWASLWIAGLLVARRRLGGQALLGHPHGALAENPRLLRFMLGANADVTFGALSGRIVPLAIGWMLGPAAAGLFAVATRATVVIAQPAQILGRAAYGELAALVARGDGAAPLRHAVGRAILVALAAATPVVIGVALLGRELAVLLGGPAFAGAAQVMLWLTAAQAVLLVAPPVSAALTALGRPGLSVAGNMLASLVMLPLLPPAMALLGLVGAGMLQLAQAVASATLLLVLLFRVTRGGRRDADRVYH